MEGSGIITAYQEILFSLNDVARNIISLEVEFDKKLSKTTLSTMKEAIDNLNAYYNNYKVIQSEQELMKK